MEEKIMANTNEVEAKAAETTLVQDLDSFNAKLAEVREAQKKFATYSQEQVDKIFKAAAIAARYLSALCSSPSFFLILQYVTT